MGEINDGLAHLVHLVEHIISEEFYDIPITRFGPPRFMIESFQEYNRISKMQREEKRDAEVTYSGRSLINPNLHNSHTSLPFSNSLIISPSISSA
jgi:hypothetical protein